MSKLNLIKKIKGFTLIEMLMTLAIFGIISGIVIFNYGDFNSEIVLSNTAYEIALQVREAQVFTLGVRGIDLSPGVRDYSSRYGVYFSKDNPKNFIFFADSDSGENEYVCDGDCASCLQDSECQNIISILRGIEIREICVSENDEVFDENGDCNVAGGAESADEITVTFKRPDPDAIIYNINSDLEFPNVGIKVTAPNEKSKAVIIRTTGQISVENIN